MCSTADLSTEPFAFASTKAMSNPSELNDSAMFTERSVLLFVSAADQRDNWWFIGAVNQRDQMARDKINLSRTFSPSHHRNANSA